MAIAGYTPGPWRHNEINPTRIQSPKDETVAALFGGTIGHDSQLSNARLIAAVPTMYEYLERRAANGDSEAKKIVDGIGGPE